MFRDASMSSRDFPAMLARESAIVDVLAARSALLARQNWHLKGDTLDDAMLYPAFETDGTPSTSATAVLTEEFRGKKSKVSHASIWNGKTRAGEGASMSCHVSDAKVLPDTFSIRLGVPTCYATVDDLAEVIRAIADTFSPVLIEASPKGYFEKQVFDDKPGVGWMLYLPKVVTTQQVPEARALIPIPGAGGKQGGTLIVSVIDAVFSVDNAEHVDAANRIEIRLVDQDLLPRYSDI